MGGGRTCSTALTGLLAGRHTRFYAGVVEIVPSGTGALGSIVGSVAKEVAKGALGAAGSRAMTGLLRSMGLHSASETDAQLGKISAQLTALTTAVEGLHQDLAGVHADLLQVDRHVVDQARAERLQVVSVEIDGAERLIRRLFGELQHVPQLAAPDRARAAQRLAAEILRVGQVEAALDTLHSALVGVEGMEQFEGTEGALELLLDAVVSRIEQARARRESVAPYAHHAYDASIAPYLLRRVATELQGAVLVVNARLADPDLVDPASRSVLAQKASESVMANLRTQCDVFLDITRNLALEDWASEFLYAGPRGLSTYDATHLSDTLLAKADGVVDGVLGRGPTVVLRVFVSNCRSENADPPLGSPEDRRATLETARTLGRVMADAIAEASWWDAAAGPPQVETTPLTSWPWFSPKLLAAIYRPTGQLLEVRLPSAQFRPGSAGFLAPLLSAIQGKLEPDLLARDDGIALFKADLSTVAFPTDSEGHPVGSLNIATYWSGSMSPAHPRP